MANIILVTGTPGTGKTTLATRLSARLGCRFVEVSRLVKTERLYVGLDQERRTLIVDETRLRKRIEALSRSSEQLVLSTHLLRRVIPARSVRKAFVLRLDPIILYKRLRRRGWSKRKAWENTEAEIVDVSLQEALSILGSSKVHEIDGTQKSPDEVFKEAAALLQEKRRARVSSVNWLARYDPIELERRL